VQLGARRHPPGKSRQDLEIISSRAPARAQLDLRHGREGGLRRVDEMRHTMPSIGGITWERLQARTASRTPARRKAIGRLSVVFIDSFPTPRARALVPADIYPGG